jgi:ankyrin repeat protein
MTQIGEARSQGKSPIPSTIGPYIFELTTRELDRLRKSPHTAPHNTLSTLLNNLAHCYHRAIGVEHDAQKGNDYTLQAARSGSYNARYFLLMRSSMKREPILGLELAERLKWTLEILLNYCPHSQRAALQNALTFADDLQSSVDLCSYSLAGIFGRRYIRIEDYHERPGIPGCVAEDNAMELRELLKARRADISSERLDTLILDILEVSVQIRRVQYSILREILLWVDPEDHAPRVAEAFSTCIKRADEAAIAIFINSLSNAWKLMEINDVVQAAMVGRPAVIRELCNLISLKVKLEAAIDNPEMQNLEDMSITKTIERYNLEDKAEMCRHFYKEVPKNLLNKMFQSSILGHNLQTFNELLCVEGVDLNGVLHLDMFGGGQRIDLGLVTPIHVSVLAWLPLFAVALLENGAEITPIPGHFLPGNPEQTTLLHLVCRPSYTPLISDEYVVFLADDDCRMDYPIVDENGKIAMSCFIPPDFGTWKAMVRLLIRAGLDIDAKDSGGFTPIRYLIRCDTASTEERIQDKLEFLLKLGASLDIIAEADSSYAVHTCWLNDKISPDTVEFVVQNTSSEILDNGPAPFSKDKRTPMREASLYGSVPACRALLRRGARLTVRDKVMFGVESPSIFPGTTTFLQQIDIVGTTGQSRAAEAMFFYTSVNEQGVDPRGLIMFVECVDPHLNSSDIVGRTRLHIAVQQEDTEAVRLLILEGALLNSKDWLGFTPLHFAYATGNQQIISMLEKARISHPREFGVDKSHNTPPILPSKIPEILGNGKEHWATLCRAYDDEMTRRAELFPDTVVGETGDVFKILNLDRSTFDPHFQMLCLTFP